MSFLGRIGHFFALHDEEEEELHHAAVEEPRRNVVPLSQSRRSGAQTNPEVAVFAPHSFADVTEIADALRGRQVVIVNLQGADRSLLQRVVDFTSGVAYTIDGRIQKLAEAIYLVVPSGVNVNAAGLRDSIEGDGFLDLGSKLGFGGTGTRG